MKPISLSRRSLLLLATLASLSCLVGCNKTPQAASPDEVAAFKGDPSKMPEADRARMLAAQQQGAAAATQTRPPVNK